MDLCANVVTRVGYVPTCRATHRIFVLLGLPWLMMPPAMATSPQLQHRRTNDNSSLQLLCCCSEPVRPPAIDIPPAVAATGHTATTQPYHCHTHAEPFRMTCLCTFTAKPWMVWVVGMAWYNVGAVAIFSVANLFIPLVLVACLFITVLVFNLIIARLWLKEAITPYKVAGSAMIIAGAGMAAAGTPMENARLQDTYPCKDGQACVHSRVSELASRPAAIASLAGSAKVT